MSAKKEDIITLPNPHLRQKSKKVGVITDEIRQLVADMTAASIDWEDARNHEITVGLAAIQIDVPLRVVVVRANFDDYDNKRFIEFINPEITKFEGKEVSDHEGCLSVKDCYGKVPRFEKVRVKALDSNGREFRMKLSGFSARLMQHEIDHLNGIVFVDRIKNDPDAFYRLTEDAKLEKLHYEQDIKNNKDLWG